MSVLASPLPSSATLPAISPPEPVWRLTLDQYHAMIEHGILTSDTPVELLDGLLVPKMSKNPPHTLATRLMREALEGVLPPGWYVTSQEPITLQQSEPEPDVSLIRGTPRDYATRHPGPADLGLVVEVADSSLPRDRKWKQVVYSQDGIVEYWLLDLVNRTLEVFTTPRIGTRLGYTTSQTYEPTDRVPVNLDGSVVGHILVDNVLPS